MFKEGDLVKVKDDYAKREVNNEWVSEHGCLWLVMIQEGDRVYCKSLATGNDMEGEGWLWYNFELEKADV